MVDMENLLKSSPFELSGGPETAGSLRRRHGGRQWMCCFFDEPPWPIWIPLYRKKTLAIDLIDRIQRQAQKTVVIIEHRLEDVLYRHVDRIVVVAEGRIAADMTPDELMATQQLSELGIREPLYVTAMKYAGISITPRCGRDSFRLWLSTMDPPEDPGLVRRAGTGREPAGRQFLR